MSELSAHKRTLTSMELLLPKKKGGDKQSVRAISPVRAHIPESLPDTGSVIMRHAHKMSTDEFQPLNVVVRYQS